MYKVLAGGFNHWSLLSAGWDEIGLARMPSLT